MRIVVRSLESQDQMGVSWLGVAKAQKAGNFQNWKNIKLCWFIELSIFQNCYIKPDKKPRTNKNVVNNNAKPDKKQVPVIYQV